MQLESGVLYNDNQKVDILDAKQGLDPDDAIDQTFIGSPLFIVSIPAEIGGLTDLVGIVMEGQGLSGSIPSSLYTLPALQQIDLPSNSLNGTIPSYSYLKCAILDFGM